MTDIIQCDALVFQTLDDLKAACTEANDGTSEVKDFEVGVFCGEYKTPVPDDYFERSSMLYGNKKRKSAAVSGEEADASAMLIASSGPVNVTVPNGARYNDDEKVPEYREDVRYASIRDAFGLSPKANSFAAFTTLLAGNEGGF